MNPVPRRQLADAILNNTINPAQYEELTLEGVATPQQVRRSLTRLWRDLYGNAPVAIEPPVVD